LYEVVSLERRAEAIDSVGHRLMNGDELTEEMAARLRGLCSSGLEPETPTFPCDPNGNWWQPVATVWR